MNSNAGTGQTTASDRLCEADCDPAFEAWLRALGFAIEGTDRAQARAAFARLAAMNQMNRSSRPTGDS